MSQTLSVDVTASRVKVRRRVPDPAGPSWESRHDTVLEMGYAQALDLARQLTQAANTARLVAAEHALTQAEQQLEMAQRAVAELEDKYD